jgi:hypothetical protein
MANVSAMASLSLLMVTVFAVFFTALSIRVFARSALR